MSSRHGLTICTAWSALESLVGAMSEKKKKVRTRVESRDGVHQSVHSVLFCERDASVFPVSIGRRWSEAMVCSESAAIRAQRRAQDGLKGARYYRRASMILSQERARVGAARARELLSMSRAPLRIALSPGEFRDVQRQGPDSLGPNGLAPRRSPTPMVSSPKPRLNE